MDPSNGKMVTGWKQVDNVTYFFETNGKMARGWVRDGSSFYYMQEGKLVTDTTIQVDGRQFSFNAKGVCTSDTSGINAVDAQAKSNYNSNGSGTPGSDGNSGSSGGPGDSVGPGADVGKNNNSSNGNNNSSNNHNSNNNNNSNNSNPGSSSGNGTLVPGSTNGPK